MAPRAQSLSRAATIFLFHFLILANEFVYLKLSLIKDKETLARQRNIFNRKKEEKFSYKSWQNRSLKK